MAELMIHAIEKSHTKKSTKFVDDLINFKPIFAHNKKRDRTILFLKKKEFDIFYSGKYKYPILVKESINILTGKTHKDEPYIDRRLIIDPFKLDPELPPQISHSLNDYDIYMIYGGSLGHNAPAGQHKTNIVVYNETFLLSNISPQEIVLNTGLWALLENWCKMLAYNKKLFNITVFTGNVPDDKSHNFNGTMMNIPIKLFKIVCFNHMDNPDQLYMVIFITNNAPYMINYNLEKYNLSSHTVPETSYMWFQNMTGLDLRKLLKFYNLIDDEFINFKSIKGMSEFKSKGIIHMDIYLTANLKLLMKKSGWFGKLVYSETLEELEKNWKDCLKFETEFGSTEFHKAYYDATKIRLSM